MNIDITYDPTTNKPIFEPQYSELDMLYVNNILDRYHNL